MITKYDLLAKAFSKEDANRAWQSWQDYQWDEEPDVIPDNIMIVYSFYNYEDYSGYGHVIGYDKEAGEFFDVFGSHCSCYGLEGQWEMEYTTLEELEYSIKKRIEACEEREWCMEADKELDELKELLEIE